MSIRSAWRTIGWEWFCALTCYSLLIAPFGCELTAGGPGGGLLGGLGGALDTGLFINEDGDDPLLIAGRNADGDAFFVFGTRNDSGGLEEIESIVVRTAGGDESFMAFQSGRPVHVEGADGSYAHISYEEVSAERLTAHVELYDAATGQESAYTVDVDLEQTAQQIAALVADVTGQELDASALSTAKESRQRVRITIFSPLYALLVMPIVAAVALTTVILGQVLVAVYALVAATVQLVLLAVFSPLFLLAEILSDTVWRVEIVPLSLIFDSLPTPPIVILV
jgi:uncharacterized membrane protein